MHTGYEAFHPTLLVGMRNRLRVSARPKRLFEDTKKTARQAGVMSDKARALDSTPVYDAVATQDTVTQLRLGGAQAAPAPAGHGAGTESPLLASAGTTTTAPGGSPPAEWDDQVAKEELVDALVEDGNASVALEGEKSRRRRRRSRRAVGSGRRPRRRAKRKRHFRDRQESSQRPHYFNGRHRCPPRPRGPMTATSTGSSAIWSIDPGAELIDEVVGRRPAMSPTAKPVDELLAPVANLPQKPDVFADSAYADGETLEHLDGQGFSVTVKVPPSLSAKMAVSARTISLSTSAPGTITCPAGQVADIRYGKDGTGRAEFGEACATCPLAERCTTNKQGRSVNVHRNNPCQRTRSPRRLKSGKSATSRPVPRWSARSPTWSASPGAGARLACAGSPGSPATS